MMRFFKKNPQHLNHYSPLPHGVKSPGASFPGDGHPVTDHRARRDGFQARPIALGGVTEENPCWWVVGRSGHQQL